MGETISGIVETVQRVIEVAVSELHSTQPGTIVSYNAGQNRAVIRPTLPKALADGGSLAAPNVSHVPLVFPVSMGGKAGFTLPMQEGDGVLIQPAQRSLEGWLSGQNTAPDDPRQFDLSDSIALPGLAANGIAPNANDVEMFFGQTKLRLTPDGSAIVEVNGGKLTITPDGIAAFEGPKVTIQGNLEVQGNIISQGNITAPAGQIIAGAVSLRNHNHLASGGSGVGGIPVGGP